MHKRALAKCCIVTPLWGLRPPERNYKLETIFDMFPLYTLITPYMAKDIYSRVFPTPYSESVQEGSFETFTKASMTEPDNAMSIPEIIARFTRGYGMPVQQHGWTSGTASEEGEEMHDVTEDFMKDFMTSQAPHVEPPKEAPQEPIEAPKEPSEG